MRPKVPSGLAACKRKHITTLPRRTPQPARWEDTENATVQATRAAVEIAIWRQLKLNCRPYRFSTSKIHQEAHHRGERTRGRQLHAPSQPPSRQRGAVMKAAGRHPPEISFSSRKPKVGRGLSRKKVIGGRGGRRSEACAVLPSGALGPGSQVVLPALEPSTPTGHVGLSAKMAAQVAETKWTSGRINPAPAPL